MNVAYLDYQLDIECPHCNHETDLVQYEADIGDNSIAGKIFTNRWDDIKGTIIECPNCNNEFQIDKVEY